MNRPWIDQCSRFHLARNTWRKYACRYPMVEKSGSFSEEWLEKLQEIYIPGMASEKSSIINGNSKKLGFLSSIKKMDHQS